MQKRAIFQNMMLTDGIYYDPGAVTLPMAEIAFLHYHDCVEIGVCAAGQGMFVIGDAFEPVSTGDAVLITPGSRHYSRSLGECRFRFVYLDPLRLTSPLLRGEEVAHRLDGAASCVLRGERAEPAARFVREATAGKHELAAILLAELALELSAAASDTAPGDEIAMDAAAYMKLHYAEPLKIAGLAQMAHLSESRFRVHFAAEYGCSPHVYLTRIRANVGAELLLHSSMSISEIAAAAGFGDASEFFRCFRKIYGVSPRSYRNTPVTALPDRR